MSPHDSAVARPPCAESGEVSAAGRSIPYLLLRSAQRRRTISIDLDAAGQVRVRAPVHAQIAEIEAFILKRANWIERARTDLLSRPNLRLITGDLLPLLGKNHRFWVQLADQEEIRFQVSRGKLHAAVPFRLDEHARTSALSEELHLWYRGTARERLGLVARRWSRTTGLKPARVLVRAQRTRWGSCSADGSIRLNWRLVMLDPALIDYVVVHELIHLRVPNHSTQFWSEVERWIPDSRQRRKQLRQAGKMLPF